MGNHMMSYQSLMLNRPFLGDDLELQERRWWITVDDLKFCLMGMCRMPHLSLRILQQSMHQLVGPMPEEEQHVSMKQVVTKDESKNEDEKKKESSTPLPQRSTNNNEEENDDPDEDEKIYFPRFVAWLCGDGEEEKEDQEENN